MYIYKTTNLINNKIYIGLSTKSVEESTDYHGSGTLLHKAIFKYGKNNFKKEIIEECDTLIELQDREKYWIDYYNSASRGVGYNIALGGTGGDTLTNHPDIEEIGQKISKANRDKWNDEEFRHKMTLLRKKIANTKQFKDKISKAQTGHPAYPNQIEATRKANSERVWKQSSIEKIRQKQTGKKYPDEVNKSKGRPGSKWYRNPLTGETTMSTTELPEPWVRGRGKIK